MKTTGENDYESEDHHVPERPESPWGTILGGFAVSVLGVILAASGTGVLAIVGFVLLAIGGILASMGTIAAGVRLGMRWYEYDRWLFKSP